MVIPKRLVPLLQKFLQTPVGQFSIRTAILLFASRHRTGVNVVCMDHHHRILLLKHVFHPFAPWGLPGGWMDSGESPRSCARRELMEETGLEASTFEILEVFHNQAPHHINIIFTTQMDSSAAQDEIRLQAAEISDARWFGPDDLPLPLSNHTYTALKKAWHTVDIELNLTGEQLAETPF